MRDAKVADVYDSRLMRNGGSGMEINGCLMKVDEVVMKARRWVLESMRHVERKWTQIVLTIGAMSSVDLLLDYKPRCQCDGSLRVVSAVHTWCVF